MSSTLFKNNALRITAGFAGLVVSSLVHAQSSVTIYGGIDTGIRYLNNTTAGGGATWGPGAGALMGSRLGFRGKEDLGGGNSASFVLENGFLPTTGSLDQQGQLLGRQAWVGLESQTLGLLQAGRIYSLPFWQLSTYDAFNFPNYLAEAWQTRFFGVRLDNSVKYTANTGPFTLQLQQAFGEQAGDTKAGATSAIGFSYSDKGIAAGVIAQRAADASEHHADVWGGGTSYTWGPMKFFGTYIHSRRDAGFVIGTTTGTALANTSMLSNRTTVSGLQTAARRDSFISLGSVYQATPVLRVGTSLMLDNVKGVAGDRSGKIKTLVALLDYQLSKRTNIYAELDRNILNGASVNDTNSPVGTFNGHASQTGITVGMRTFF